MAEIFTNNQDGRRWCGVEQYWTNWTVYFLCKQEQLKDFLDKKDEFSVLLTEFGKSWRTQLYITCFVARHFGVRPLITPVGNWTRTARKHQPMVNCVVFLKPKVFIFFSPNPNLQVYFQPDWSSDCSCFFLFPDFGEFSLKFISTKCISHKCGHCVSLGQRSTAPL